MKRIHGLVAACVLCITLSAALATPPVLDRVPDNALITIVVPAPTTMQKNLAALAAAVESPAAVPALDDLLAMAGLGGGIDTSKSMAIVVIGPKELDNPPVAKAAKPEKDADKHEHADGDMDGDEHEHEHAEGDKDAKRTRTRHAVVPADDDAIDWETGMQRTVMLIPLTKYADFLENFGATPAGEGKLDEINIQGEDAFCKPLDGGYAVVGNDRELVRAFTGKGGDATLVSRMSAAGRSLSDSADMVAIVNIDRIRPFAQNAMATLEKEARSRMEMMGQEGLEKNIAVAKWMGETVIRDTQVVVAGWKTGSMGMTMDLVGSFKPDSYLARTFTGAGSSTPILGKLFAGNYLFAGAIDMSSKGTKQFTRDLVSKSDVPGGEPAVKAALAAVESADGQGAVMGFPVGGAFSGILTSTVVYTASKDPGAAMKAWKDSMTAMNGATIQDYTYVTKVVENASKAGDTPLHAWEVKMQSQTGEIPAEMQQAMPMLFGPQGMPAGYIAQGPGGLYTSYAKNSELMAKALNAEKEGSLASDAMIVQAQGMLPKNRMAEAYLGTRGLLDLGLPLLAFTGTAVPMDKIPEKLPPIAASLSAEEGAMHLSMVIPAPVMKIGITLAEAVQEARAQGGQKGTGKPDKGTGQPKF